MEKINLEEILSNEINFNMNHWINEVPFRKKLILNAMKEACRQTLEVAAEKVLLETTETMCGCPECGVIGINKQSIFNVIDLIE